MCLLITLTAAVICTLIWYTHADNDIYKTSILSMIYWGASLMWFVDAVYEYIELGSDYFNQSISELLNDSILGICAVVLGLTAWLIYLLIKDPKDVLKKKISKTTK